MKSPKKWSIWALILTSCILLVLGTFTAVIDPVFHYHKPLPGLSYYLWDERYQNDGIVKQFDYDAIITGTSMTENIRSSEVDALFGVNSVKTSFSGTTLREIANHLRRAFRANDGIEMVIMGIDGKNLFDGVEQLRTDEVMPDYLYDDNLLNDVSYVLNKDILLRYTMMVLQQTYYGNETTSFDKYAFWWETAEPGPETVLGSYNRRPEAKESYTMLPELEQRVRQTIRANIVSLAQENPDTLFYCYFTPYSMVYWDQQNREGTLRLQLEAYRIATEELLRCGNIRLFSFYTVHEWTHDLHNYSDAYHHSDGINSRILEQIHAGNHRLTQDSFEAYWSECLDYYVSVDYDAYLASWGWEDPA